MMPDVDGYQICTHIKQHPQLNHAHVVFLSARSADADIQKGLQAGASLYITKPFSTRELVKQVNKLLQG
jgi:DNA-binding response OmpR family regulator